MNLVDELNVYCERTGPEFWSEPINALTNLAFVIVAALIWPRTKIVPEARILTVILASVGLASGVFHTVAQVWAALADSLSIVVFAIYYIYLANRDYLAQPPRRALLMTAGFVPYAVITIPLFSLLPVLGVSAAYMPLPVMIFAYGVWLWRNDAQLGRGLVLGAFILLVSLTFRSFDMALCASIPFGTHFMWHILNGVMLGWMILVYLRFRARD